MNTESNTLSIQGISAFFPNSVRDRVSNHIHIYDSLESTNITAKEFSLSGAAHGTVIIADSQTKGKGRHGKAFHSPPGHGIYMSFVLNPDQLSISTNSLITLSAAITVCEAIEAVTDKSPKVKWVNDIFLDGRKVCGILTESVIGAQSHIQQGIILGIGINFTTPLHEFPDQLQQTAGALFEAQSPPITRNQLISEIIYRIIYPNASYSEEELLVLYSIRQFL